ncbi:protein FAM237A-like [Stigmatopora argus]
MSPLAATVLALSCVCAMPLHLQVDPLTVPRTNPQCWDSASAVLLEMRSPRLADTVPAFWDLMVVLRASDEDKHAALFWDLARVFWEIYLDCVMSRSHGLGRRRYITGEHPLATDKSFKFNSSGENWRLRLSFQVRHNDHIKSTKRKINAY